MEEPFVLFQETISLFDWQGRSEDGTYVVVHVSGAHKVGTNVVCPLNWRGLSTIIGDVSSVVDNILARQQGCPHCPVIRLVGPVCIGLVTSVSGKASSKLEKAPVGDTVFVVVTFVKREDLPTESPSAILVVPAYNLFIEDCLSER